MSWAVWYPGIETTQIEAAPPAPPTLMLIGYGRGILFVLSFLLGALA